MSFPSHASGDFQDFDKPLSQSSLVLGYDSIVRRIPTNGVSKLSDPVQRRNPIGQTFTALAGLSTYSDTAVGTPANVADDKVGVLLLNLGGPETLNDVQPFLFNLFVDPVCPFKSFILFPFVS